MTPRLPRRLHAGAWWLWALTLIVAATQTTNPLLLGSILAVTGLVVAARRSSSSWAGGYRAYLVVAGVVVLIRTVFRVLLGGGFGEVPLFSLPELSLPGWAATASIGGAVTVEQLLAGVYDGLRLATIIVCVGAANTLADPRRLVSSLPKALHAVATASVVALSLAPQLIESFARLRRARRLRGEASRGWRGLRPLLVPLLDETLHRSLALAASMEGRGYGRTAAAMKTQPGLASLGLGTLAVGAFWMVTRPASFWAPVVMAGGAVVSAIGLVRSGRGVVRTRYRSTRWTSAEWIVGVSGAVAAAGVIVTGALDPTALRAPLQPLGWPAFPPVAVVTILMAAIPALAAPPTPSPVTATPTLREAAG